MADWFLDPRTAQLVGGHEERSLYCAPADLITAGADPTTGLALVQYSTSRVLTEAVNHWPRSRLQGRYAARRLASRTSEVAQLVRALQGEGLSFADSLEDTGAQPVEQVLKVIRIAREATGQLLEALPEKATELSLPRIALTSTDKKARDVEACLQALASEMEAGVIAGLYVHGSVASNDTTSFSDLDGLLTLPPPAERDPRALIRAASAVTASCRCLLARDVLQHHGWFIAAPFLLEAWPQDLLPSATLQEARSVCGPDRLPVRFLTCRLLARRRLWAMVQVFRQLHASGADTARKPKTIHDEKMLLSQFMLLPALYLQATGRQVPKRESFDLARRELPGLNWDTMDSASLLRLEWSQPEMGRTWSRVADIIGPWEAQAMWRRLHLRAGAHYGFPRIPESGLEDMHRFAEDLLGAAEMRNREVHAT